MSNERKLRPMDMRLIESLFESAPGYVLDFSNATFAEFFRDELGVDIYDPRYAADGHSKGKRLRYYLRNSQPDEVIRALKALWEYRESNRRLAGTEEQLPDARVEFYRLIQRLGGQPPQDISFEVPESKTTELNASTAAQMRQLLLQLTTLEPQARGYAFEGFLKQLFDANGLAGRDSFRLVGEQIDGSFQVQGETYLLEARWTAQPVGSADLRSFNAKVEDKAAWSRGLFISESGFSADGLVAFGRGKRVVCMDGLDLNDMLERRIHMSEVLHRKVRRAAETGHPFVRVRDLF